MSERRKADEAAAAWDARLRGARASARDRAAFQAWLKQDAEHEAAHDRLQAALSLLRANARLPELSALRDEARGSVRASRRRRLVLAVSAGLAACLLLMLAGLRTERSIEVAALLQGDKVYVTSPDERAKVTLADGSVVTLDSDTRMLARIGGKRRDITLLAGRALFDVAKDPQRPFVVKAGNRTITALGTLFDVDVSPTELRVTLAEGVVAVRPARSGAGPAQQILKPRQQLVATAGAAAPKLRTVDTDKILGWADGRVFFDNERLASAIEDMNHYSSRKITVDPAVADLRINGMFRTDNRTGFLDALEMTLPVAVRTDSQGGIHIFPDAGRAAGQEGDGS